MREQALVRPVAEETVRHDDDSVARSEERISDRLQGGMTRSRDREDVRIWGGPDVPHHLPRFGVGIHPAVAVVRCRGLRKFLAHLPSKRDGAGNEKYTRLHGTASFNGFAATSSV